MICDDTEQFDFREVVRGFAGDLPEHFWWGNRCIVIAWTDTAFGGRRPWVLCPECAQRRAILYRRPYDFDWACRACLKGHYRSEHRSPTRRKLHRAFKIRRRLGQGDNNILRPFPEKPPFMHWRTYSTIREEALRLENEIIRSDVAAVKNCG